MTSTGFIRHSQIDPFDERVGIIWEELSLALQWDLPSIILVVYNSEFVRVEAETVVRNYLIAHGQKIAQMELDEYSSDTLASLMQKFHTQKDHIFFLHGANSEHRGLLAKLGSHKDLLAAHKTRLVIWLTTQGLVEMAVQARDLWEYRQRIVEFLDVPSSEYVLQDAIETEWQGIGESSGTFKETVDKISLHESALVDLSEKEETAATRARLLLTLGILNWRNGTYEKAETLLSDAIRTAAQLDESWLEAECHNAIALVKFALGKNDEAIQAYKQAVEIAPEQLYVWNNLGNLCLKINKNDEAMLAFQKTLANNPKDAIAWNGLGLVYNRIGYFTDAISAFRKSIEIAPLLAGPWAGLADAYVRTGQDQEAVRAYQKAIELNKNLAEPWMHLAEIFIRQSRFRDAVKTYQRALAVNPKNHQIWNQLGLAFLQLKSYEEAMHAFLRAIEIDRSSGMVYSNLSVAYAQQGLYLDAIAASQKSLQIVTEPTVKILVLDRLAGYYRALNDYQNAMEVYQTADQLKTPLFISINLQLENSQDIQEENLESHQGEEEKKEEVSLQSVEEAAELSESFKGYPAPAWIYPSVSGGENGPVSRPYSENGIWKDREFNEVVELSEKNQEKEEPMDTENLTGMSSSFAAVSSLGFSEDSLPSDPLEDQLGMLESRDPKVWNSKGNIHFQDQDYENAIAAYNKSIELDRSFGWPYGNLAHTYLQMGKYAEAILLYQKSASLLEKKEEKAAAWNALGNIYRHLNEYENALHAYQKADECDPQGAGQRDRQDLSSLEPNSHSAQVWLELGNLFFKSGLYKEAAGAYGNAVKIDPTSAWAQSNLAMSLVYLGKYREAASIYLKSIDLFETDTEKAITWNRLGNVYRKMNDEYNARKAYQNAVSLSNEKASLLTRTRFSLLGNCYAN